jgi:hypothetical protein
MSELLASNPIVANGEYDLKVIPGRAYIFSLKGSFGAGTVTMTIRSNIDTGTFDAVDGGAWTAPTEDTLTPTGSIVRLTLTGATAPSIRATIIPIRYTP